MQFRTHISFGFLIALIFLKYFSVEHQLIFSILIIIASALPDIDSAHSKVSVPLLSHALKHRGFFHAIYIPFILFSCSVFTTSIYLFAMALGYLSHIFIDSFTKEGINYLHPFTTIHFKGFIRTGSFLENLLLLTIWVIILILIF